MMSDFHILVVDDEPLVRHSLGEILTLEGYAVSTAPDAASALEILHSRSAEVVIADINMPGLNGIGLLKEIKKNYADISVILITGYGSIESAVAAMKEGAFDYVTKPILDNEIKIILHKIFEQKALEEENRLLKRRLDETKRSQFHNIIGKDEKMQKIYNLIDAIAHTKTTVLIHGESGTGKRLVAQAIHFYSKDSASKPFVEVSCGALPENLLESELFGHVKGSFTGAIKDRVGRFELAHGGTIFLDEIDAFTPALQVKLLRVLQEGDFERVGDSKTFKVNVRVVVATNQNLEELIKQGKFREDLYYRINVISIELPPLRERREDIAILAQHFIEKHSRNNNKEIKGLSERVSDLLESYNWPGNVRELENVIERALILTKSETISEDDLSEKILSATDKGIQVRSLADDDNGKLLKEALKQPEKEIIINTLNKVNWNRIEAARLLGISRTTLYKKMQKFNITKH